MNSGIKSKKKNMGSTEHPRDRANAASNALMLQRTSGARRAGNAEKQIEVASGARDSGARAAHPPRRAAGAIRKEK